MILTEQTKEWLAEKWHDLIGWRLSYLKTSITNVIKWFPIIWNDRDFDGHYAFEILKFKLNKQANYVALKGNPIEAKHIRVVTRLIDLVQSEFYLMEWADYYETEWEFSSTEDPAFKKVTIKTTTENFSGFYSKYPHAYAKVVKPGDSKDLIAMNISVYNHNKAKDLLFKILKNDIEKWWL